MLALLNERASQDTDQDRTVMTNSLSESDMAGGKVGLLGGTFDPVHIGHLRTAIELCDVLSLDHLKLIPCHVPSHRDLPNASTAHRIKMLREAIGDIERLSLDTREAERDEPSYTVDTLTSFRQELPNATLLFCMGMDAFNLFTTWHRWEEVLSLAHLVVVDRPGSELDGAEAELLARRRCTSPDTLLGVSGSILLLSVTQFDVSATRIRELVSLKRDISYLVPVAVSRYISMHNLYQD